MLTVKASGFLLIVGEIGLNALNLASIASLAKFRSFRFEYGLMTRSSRWVRCILTTRSRLRKSDRAECESHLLPKPKTVTTDTRNSNSAQPCSSSLARWNTN